MKPVNTKPRQTLNELRDLQRLAGKAIMRPLDQDDRTQRVWIDNRDMRDVAAGFIKPNDRLTSIERLEIYNRQYWFRLIDILWDDHPGLRAVLGDARFNRLIRAYLDRYPSRSFTLRNLGSRIVRFIEESPHLVRPRFNLVLDMARFEWAQVIAFDGPANPPLTVADLLGKNPQKLRMSLQPYLTVLQLRYPLDDFVLELKKDNLRGEASNASDESRQREDDSAADESKRTPLPRRKKVTVVVHRHKNMLYYKRLDLPAFGLLSDLQSGKTLAQSLDRLKNVTPAQIQDWFQTWTSLGWFCKYQPMK